MPAGIPKRITQRLESLGYSIHPYRVKESRAKAQGDPLDMIVGVELRLYGAIIGVTESVPRGWGGDGLWHVRPTRSVAGAPFTAMDLSVHKRQRDALAALIERSPL